MPVDFEPEYKRLIEGQAEAVERNLSELIHQLAQERRNQTVLVDAIISLLNDVPTEHRLPPKLLDALKRLQDKANLVGYRQAVEELDERPYGDKNYAESPRQVILAEVAMREQLAVRTDVS